ncbi:hypothetical protein TWF694_001489 [Orbilia ellipsospora]|uniref:Uncharacterized protein n=1 Tax=Orbilia ellipsospora TaxID=2528407 RepID=A0AAV9XV48_9PEZI
MPPYRNRHPQSEPLLNPQPPAYATFDPEQQRAANANSHGSTSERVTYEINRNRPDISPEELKRSADLCYRIFRCIIITAAFITCFTVSLPFLFKQHHHSRHDLNRNSTVPVCPPPPPPPPPPPFAKYNDQPQAGSSYVLTDSETGLVITYSDGTVFLSEYRSASDQHWTCREKDGWLGFAMKQPGKPYMYLGFMDPPTLRCIAPWHRFNEMFVVVKRPDWGFKVYLRDEDALKPLGKDKDGNLARVPVSDIWWGFTKVN